MKNLRAAARAGVTVALAAYLIGCKGLLDVNENPNAPEQARVDIRLPALITMFVHSTYYGENALWGAEWLQQFSYNRATRSYAEVHRYELAETDAHGEQVEQRLAEAGHHREPRPAVDEQ